MSETNGGGNGDILKKIPKNLRNTVAGAAIIAATMGGATAVGYYASQAGTSGERTANSQHIDQDSHYQSVDFLSYKMPFRMKVPSSWKWQEEEFNGVKIDTLSGRVNHEGIKITISAFDLPGGTNITEHVDKFLKGAKEKDLKETGGKTQFTVIDSDKNDLKVSGQRAFMISAQTPEDYTINHPYRKTSFIFEDPNKKGHYYEVSGTLFPQFRPDEWYKFMKSRPDLEEIEKTEALSQFMSAVSSLQILNSPNIPPSVATPHPIATSETPDFFGPGQFGNPLTPSSPLYIFNE